jgi:hypothetical protein
MKNFLRLATGCDVTPLLVAIHTKDLWNKVDIRTNHQETAHSEVDDILLRFNSMESIESIPDEHESVNFPAFSELPQARPLVFGLMARVEGERLGRCIIAKLKPGSKVYPHVDGGSHASYYKRFHIILQSSPGVVFRSGDEVVYMAPGDVWWFDNSKEHEVINNSADDRIHLIVDIRK